MLAACLKASAERKLHRIDGNGPMSTIFTSAEEAEDAFYEAIGRADLDAMMECLGG